MTLAGLAYRRSCTCILAFTLISILELYNNGGYLEARPRLFRLLNLLISKNFKSYALLTFKQAQAKAADQLQ